MSERGEQGVPGEQGVRGNQGIQGVPGRPADTKPISGPQGVPGKSGQVVLDKRVELSFWALVAVFVAVTGAFGYQVDKTRDLAKANRKLIVQAAQTRADVVSGFKRADYRLCIGQEKLKEQNRAEAKRFYNARGQTLRLLNLTGNAEAEQLFLERFERDMRLNKARPNGCRTS